ncbi:MAG: thioredoxin-disulfide reductase [Alphaproteobacteria bacterium]|nr:thioredoxin-disulfide reductase [Alphaproteobacteria bacterium]
MGSDRYSRVVIIGTGPAGYTAAIYTARAQLEPLVIDGLQPGGQLSITNAVENYPGFPEGIHGPQMMDLFRAQAERFGTRYQSGMVNRVDFTVRPFKIWVDDVEHTADAVIIATGASARYLGLPSEERLKGRGVSACATCDGFFYRGKEVVVVGGGNTAVEEALFLTNFAAKVTVVHRREEFRAEKILQDRLFANPKVEVIWNSAIEEIVGVVDGMAKNVTGVRLKNVQDGSTQEIPADGVFIAIGHAPSSELFKGQLETNSGGYLRVKPGTAATAIEGVWAAGDVTDDIYRQAVTAAGMGCMAALEVSRFLAEEDHAKAHNPISHKEAEKIGVW